MRNRFVAIILASACTVLLVVACSDNPTTSVPSTSIKSPAGPNLGFVPLFGCSAVDFSTCAPLTAADAHTEALKVCKMYPAGTVNPPAVQIHLDVKTENAERFPLPPSLDFTLQPNTCRHIWQNGEDFGPKVDTVWVTEVVPAGYTASSQVTTIRRVGPRQTNPADNVFTTTANAATPATTVKGFVGGYEIPGLTVTFTNTFTPPPPPAPSCTFTQGYWKNHEDVWPAPYSPTTQWMKAGHLVNGTTWDGLMSIAPKGGNSYLQLAHQWIAATLNGAAGAPAVSTTLNDAGAWLEANTPATGPVPFVKNAQANAWASTLDDFNNGRLGTPHCD
jgi:hypothetical protein